MDTYGDDKIEVDTVELGTLNQRLKKNILNIWKFLDDFIYKVRAQLELVDMELFMIEIKESE